MQEQSKKKDNTLSSRESFRLDGYKASDSRVNAAIVGYGYPYNFRFFDNARPGDTVVFDDDMIATIQAKVLCNIGHPYTDAMSRLCYGISMRKRFNEMLSKFGKDIQTEDVIIIVYNDVHRMPYDIKPSSSHYEF